MKVKRGESVGIMTKTICILSQPTTSPQDRSLWNSQLDSLQQKKMDLLDNDDQPDTLPGFKMQSEHFVLKFITGLQKGVCRLRKSN